MPEAVDEYYKTGDFRRVDVILKSILDRMTDYLINSTPKKVSFEGYGDMEYSNAAHEREQEVHVWICRSESTSQRVRGIC